MNKKIKKLVPALRFPEFEGIWEETNLGKLSEKPNYGLNASAVKFDGKHKYIRITDIDDNTRSFSPNPLTSPDSGMSPDYQLQENDLVFVRTGASVGKSYLYRKEDGELYFAGYLIKFSVKSANSTFVYYLTLTNHYVKYVAANSMRSGQPGINAEEYSKFSFCIPKIEEQEKIASFLGAIDTRLTQLCRKHELLQAYKRGLISEIFTHKIGKRKKEKVPNLRFVNFTGDWQSRKLEEFIVKKNSNAPENVPLYSLTIENGVTEKTARYERSFLVKDENEAYKLVETNDFVYNPMNVRWGALARHKQAHFVKVSKYYDVFSLDESVDVYFVELLLTSYNSIQYYDHMAAGSLIEKKRLHFVDFLEFKFLLPSVEEQEKIVVFLTSIGQKIEAVSQQIQKMFV
jgi:type I restriction enzyme, S subunit